MQEEYAPLGAPDNREARGISDQLRARLVVFLSPLLIRLDRQIDQRLVRTFVRAVEVILSFRHRQYGLLLSELGAYLLSPEHAPAGTKRLSNLLRCPKWRPFLVSRFLWEQAQGRLAALEATGTEALLVWDDSVLEKPESSRSEGLGPVRSAKAARLKRIKPGYFQPPGGPPVHVPGQHWLALLLLGSSGPPSVALMRWWSARAQAKGAHRDPRRLRAALLRLCAQRWGRRVLHIWDRGYAGGPWLGRALTARVRFVLRWPKGWKLLNPDGDRQPAWHFSRGQRSWGERMLRDPRRGDTWRLGVWSTCLQHPDYPDPLWLVVARSGSDRGRREPWYLLTNEPIETEADAWRIVMAYARRWQIEMAFRYGKSELALESPRLWRWECRLKLLFIVTLAYAFLLSLLDPCWEWLREWLLRHFCHRTGKRSQETLAPLYRLRSALSRLWLAYPAIAPVYCRNPG